MLFLMFYIFDNAIFCVDSARERAVSVLPVVKGGKDVVFFDPFGGGNLDLFDQIRQRDRRVQAGEQMDVIFDAADAVEVAVPLFDDAPDIFVKIIAVFFQQNGLSIFGCEDDVVNNLGVGGHIGKPCWGLQSIYFGSTGVARGYAWVSPPGKTRINPIGAFFSTGVPRALPVAMHGYPLRGKPV